MVLKTKATNATGADHWISAVDHQLIQMSDLERRSLGPALILKSVQVCISFRIYVFTARINVSTDLHYEGLISSRYIP
jgi:hypothetical protein